MQLNWHFDSKDVERLSAFIKAQRSKAPVLDRIRKNVDRSGLDISSRATWRALIGCLITTQQPSGANSKVAQFMASDSVLFDLDACRNIEYFSTHSSRLLAAAGLRRNATIGKQLESALPQFSSQLWDTLGKSLEANRTDSTLASERACATLFRETFDGLGPKQSRNLIQALGISRYVVPLDSRFSKHLKKISFPVPVSAPALQDESYYCFVEDGIQRLSEAIGEYPCVYDAAVFASFG